MAYEDWGRGYGSRVQGKGLRAVCCRTPTLSASSPLGECPSARSPGRRTRGQSTQPAPDRPSPTSYKVQDQHKAPATPATPATPHHSSTAHLTLAPDPATSNHLPPPCTSHSPPIHSFSSLLFLPPLPTTSSPRPFSTPLSCSTPAPLPARATTSTAVATLPISSFGQPFQHPASILGD